MLSFLTKIPLLLFIGCFFWGVLIGSPLKCHAQTFSNEGILSQQNGDNLNTIDQTMTAFENATQLMKIHALILAKNAAEAQQREEETKDRAKAETFYYQVFLTDSYAPMKKHVWK